jgi:hypothetical protein
MSKAQFQARVMIRMQWNQDDLNKCDDALLSVIVQELSKGPEDN